MSPNFMLYVRADGSHFIVGRISVGRFYVIVGQEGRYATRREAVAAGHAVGVLDEVDVDVVATSLADPMWMFT